MVRTDSFLSLAVRYGVHPTAIKRVNNMISDHSLHSRLEVYVPVASEADLAGKYVQVGSCPHASRKAAVPCGGAVAPARMRGACLETRS